MAKVIQCDICGEECKPNGRYELIYKNLFGGYKRDICYNCIMKIEKMIISKKII